MKHTGSLGRASVALMMSSLGLASGEEAQTVITRWPHGKKAAVSLTYDDGSINQFRVAAPLMNSLALPATFFVITGDLPGSRYRGTFIGRSTEAIVRETADVPTDKSNLFERASAIGHLGLAGTLEYHSRAGDLYEDGDPDGAYKTIDEGYAKVRQGAFEPKTAKTGFEGARDSVTWDALQALAGQGHEIASHTVTHPRLAVLDEPNLAYELEKSRLEILERLGPRHTFSVECPYGTEDERAVRRALEIYPASRNRMPEPFLEELNRSSQGDPTASRKEYVQWQRGALTKTPMRLMKSWIETVLARDNVWLVLVFHGVDGIGWEPKTGAELKEYFQYVKSREDQLWVATFQDVAKYMRERQRSEVRTSRKGDVVEVVLRHGLDPKHYDLPLTLRTRVPSEWNAVEIRQGSRVQRVAVARDGAAATAEYQAVPNAGPVTLAGLTPTAHVRVNQVGYRPGDSKIALALSGPDLSGQPFEVRPRHGDGVAFRGRIGRDRGRYGRFAHVYELDFTSLTAKGTFFLRLGDADSPPFALSPDAHAGLLSKSLEFFRTQRCGGARPGRSACHLDDGVAKGGPADEKRVRADGGWHDAGDYIKFLITGGYATHLMLATYTRHPDSFPDDDGNGLPDVLEEARVGLDWMLKLWDAPNGVLYYQVSDAGDHSTWRLPEQDKLARPVWACEPGRGANVAGKAAASLALGAVIWGDKQRSYADAGLASTFLKAAREIYVWGKERPQAQPSNPPEFYGERSFEDNMALAAAALYRATGEAAYLAEARDFLRGAGSERGFSWADSHALARYELARLDPASVADASQHFRASLEAARAHAESEPFRVGLERLHWGSAPVMAGIALQAFWYHDLTGEGRYLALGQSQWDYLLGANPWGVCFVNGAGTTWSRFPHHQIADLTRTPLTGFWNEGPVPLTVFEGRKITLSGPDAYAAFQSDGAVYHDDKEDYVTNEPTLTSNATGIALAAWYLSAARP
jgi:peptidoglycan/xylan/chitin deacetylase (PgdA/CDA1 family)